MKLYLRILSFILGLFLIIGVAIEVSDIWGTPITVLNASVLGLGYCILWSKAFFSLIKEKEEDQTESWVAMLGPRIIGFGAYMVIAIGIMFYCNHKAPDYQTPFRYQLFAQIALLALYLLFTSWALAAGERAEKVYAKEQTRKEGKVNMKLMLNNLNNTASLAADVPMDVKKRIADIHESIRFISPNPSYEAQRLEYDVYTFAQNIQLAIQSGYQMNAQNISKQLDILELTLKNRKALRE